MSLNFPRYKLLLTYRYSEIIFDLTNEFVKKFLSEIDHRRTREQMFQAARSGKQNIAEGSSRVTSRGSEMTLLDVAMTSLEELTNDYEDFLRQRNLEIWPKIDPRILNFRQIGFRLSDLRNLSALGFLIEKPVLPANPTAAANFLLTLCHQNTYLLSRQIESVRRNIVEKGGFHENLAKERLNFQKSLNNPKSLLK